MLDQEIIFHNQLLMNGDSKYPRCQLFPMKRTFMDCHSVGSTRFISNGSFLHEDQNFCSRYQQRHLDLRLSTNNFSDYNVLDGDELNLSLSIGRSTNKRNKISGSSWKNKIGYPSSHEIIDLEESTGTGSNEDQSSQNFTEHLKNVANLHQDHLKKDASCKKGESSRNSGIHQEWSSINQGSIDWHDDVKQTKLIDFDLNEVQPDESSFHSNDPVGPNFSCDGSSDESCSNISTSLTFKGQTSQKDGQTKTFIIDLETIPEPSSDLTEENEINISEASNQKEIKETDYAEEKAALSLISISQLRALTNKQDSETITGSNEIEKSSNQNKKTIKRSSSIDSYESLVLKLEESSIDEDSATSKAFEINEFDQKKNGIKLKRGRRMKDFQKDVLPTLSSLSKDEIWEDIKLLEGIIKSREYKRLNKAKTGKGENWFTPVKSKRSKVNYVSPKCSLKKKN